MKTIFQLSLLFLSTLAVAQPNSGLPGDMKLSQSERIGIDAVGETQNQITTVCGEYTVAVTKVKGKLFINSFSKTMSPLASSELQLKEEEGTMYITNLIGGSEKGHVVMYLKDFSKRELRAYALSFDPKTAKPLGEVKLLKRYSYGSLLLAIGALTVETSKSGNTFAVLFRSKPEDKNASAMPAEVTVFDNSLNEVNSGKFTLAGYRKEVRVRGFRVDDNGNVVVSHITNLGGTPGWDIYHRPKKLDRKAYVTTVANAKTGMQGRSYEISIPGHMATEVSAELGVNNQVYCIGTYNLPQNVGAVGSFFATIDAKAGSISSVKTTKFSAADLQGVEHDMLKSAFTMNVNVMKNKKAKGLWGVDFSGSRLMNDESIVLALEERYELNKGSEGGAIYAGDVLFVCYSREGNHLYTSAVQKWGGTKKYDKLFWYTRETDAKVVLKARWKNGKKLEGESNSCILVSIDRTGKVSHNWLFEEMGKYIYLRLGNSNCVDGRCAFLRTNEVLSDKKKEIQIMRLD